MRKFLFGLGKHVKKECKATLLILDTDISRLMVYAKQLKEDKKRDREENMSKRAKSVGHQPSQHKHSKGDKSYFKKRSSSYTPSSASAQTLSNMND